MIEEAKAMRDGAGTTIEQANSNKLRTRAWLMGVVLVAIILRVAFSGKSLWLDEGVSVANAWANGMPLSAWRDWLREMWKGEFNMVFYFALLRVWMRAGTSEIFLRLLSVIPAVATIPVVYGIGKKIASARVGFIAALLISFHGWHVIYSQEVRSYTLVVFLCTAATWYFLKGIEENRSGHWVMYWLCLSLGVYSHFFAGLVLIANWVSLIWLPRKTVGWKKAITASFGVVIASLPALLFAATNKGGQVDWIPRPSLGQALNVITEFAGSPTALPLYLFLWMLAILRPGRRWWNQRSTQAWHLAIPLAWVAVPFLLTLAISAIRPMLLPRYLLLCAPGAALLAAIGADELSWKRARIAIAGALLLSLAFLALRYSRPKEDWRGASDYVLNHATEHDAVIVSPWWTGSCYEYYRNRRQGTHPQEIRTGDADRALRIPTKPSRLWIVEYTRGSALSDPGTQTLKNALASGYKVEEQHNFNLVRVRLYTAPAIGQ